MTAGTIQSLRIHNQVLTPAEAELRFVASVQAPGRALELSGRLLGPRCRYASTVEVAYPIRPLGSVSAEGNSRSAAVPLSARTVIPEPNWWEPASPFLYHGLVELRQDGQVQAQVPVRHGLRKLELGAAGFRLNGKPFAIQAVVPPSSSAEELLRLHREGCNTLLVPLGKEAFWDLADELGFFVIGHCSGPDIERALPEIVRKQHASALGWLITEQNLALGDCRMFEALVRQSSRQEPFLAGIELTAVPSAPLPGWISFALCSKELRPGLEGIALPTVVVREMA